MTTRDERRVAALRHLTAASGTPAGADSVDLFIEHHLTELPASYWEQHLGAAQPAAPAVVGLLQFSRAWGRDDAEYFDFTLPGGVTNYVVTVHFNEGGAIDSLAMES